MFGDFPDGGAPMDFCVETDDAGMRLARGQIRVQLPVVIDPARELDLYGHPQPGPSDTANLTIDLQMTVEDEGGEHVAGKTLAQSLDHVRFERVAVIRLDQRTPLSCGGKVSRKSHLVNAIKKTARG